MELTDDPKYIRFIAPKATKQECANPTFADKHLHRVGVYKGDRPTDGGLDGWSLKAECVQCKRQFKYPYFLVMTKGEN